MIRFKERAVWCSCYKLGAGPSRSGGAPPGITTKIIPDQALALARRARTPTKLTSAFSGVRAQGRQGRHGINRSCAIETAWCSRNTRRSAISIRARPTISARPVCRFFAARGPRTRSRANRVADVEVCATWVTLRSTRRDSAPGGLPAAGKRDRHVEREMDVLVVGFTSAMV